MEQYFRIELTYHACDTEVRRNVRGVRARHWLLGMRGSAESNGSFPI